MECKKCRSLKVFIKTEVVNGKIYDPFWKIYFCSECGDRGLFKKMMFEFEKNESLTTEPIVNCKHFGNVSTIKCKKCVNFGGLEKAKRVFPCVGNLPYGRYTGSIFCHLVSIEEYKALTKNT